MKTLSFFFHKLLASEQLTSKPLIPKGAIFIRHAKYDYTNKVILESEKIPKISELCTVFCGNADRHIKTAEHIKNSDIVKLEWLNDFDLGDHSEHHIIEALKVAVQKNTSELTEFEIKCKSVFIDGNADVKFASETIQDFFIRIIHGLRKIIPSEHKGKLIFITSRGNLAALQMLATNNTNYKDWPKIARSFENCSIYQFNECQTFNFEYD